MALGSQSCFFGLGRGRVRVSLTVNELGIAEIFYVQTAKVNEVIEVLFTSGNSSEHSRNCLWLHGRASPLSAGEWEQDVFAVRVDGWSEVQQNRVQVLRNSEVHFEMLRDLDARLAV